MFGASSSAEREEEKAAEAARDGKDRLGAADGEGHRPPTFDPVSVLETAGVSAEQRERVERTLELLKALPAETSASIRKDIVEASLKAFDISIKAIVEAANAELAAFRSFIAAGHRQLDEQSKKSGERIRDLQAEISKLQTHLEVAASDQASLDQAAIAASERVRPVLGFFAEASSRVANDTLDSQPPAMIIDENLNKAG